MIFFSVLLQSVKLIKVEDLLERWFEIEANVDSNTFNRLIPTSDEMKTLAGLVESLTTLAISNPNPIGSEPLINQY